MQSYMRLSSKPIRACLAVLFSITCAASLNAASTTVTFQQGVSGYTSTLDTDLNANEPDRVQGNDNACLADLDNPIAQALVRFENIFGTGPGQVPPGATIQSATLRIRTSNLGDLCRGFRIMVPWDETTSTWNSHVGGFTADGIEMEPTVLFELDSVAVGDIFNLDITSTVQGWYAGTFPNYGVGITNAGSDGWQFDSSEAGTVANRPLLSITFDSPCQPISIVNQPAGVTVNELGNASFSVVASGTGMSFQWFKDGGLLDGQTNSTLNLTNVLRTAEGNYSVSIINECSGPVLSADAFLDVIPDDTLPSIACAFGTNDVSTIFVQFSEVVTNATDALNYSVFPTGDPTTLLTVASAVFPGGASQGNVVVLTLDPGSTMAPGGSYSISVSAVFDLVGNENDSTEVTPISRFAERIFGISAAQIWTFNDSGNDLGTAWRQVGYDDSGWSNGPAVLGFETATIPEPLRTPTSRTNAAGGVIRTHYFRTHFNYTGAPGEGVLQFRTILDDAAAIYINGLEVFRIRLPAGPLTAATEGTGAAVGDGAYEGPFTVCVPNLVTGDNVIAVEVHQTGANSSDMVWGMELSSVASAIIPVTIETQPVGTNVTIEPGPFSLRVIAGGSNPQYQWYRDGNPIDGATNAIYSVASSRCSQSGTYHVVVFNDAPSSVTSANAVVNIGCDTTAPVVSCLYGTNDVIVVVFSEPTTNGLETFNYLVTPVGGGAGLAVTPSYTTGTNFGTTVLLVIDPSTPRDPNASYQISIENDSDRFGNLMTPVTLDIPFFASPPKIAMGASWRYDTSGTDFGANWAGTVDTTSWLVGNAPFDAKRPPRTIVGGYTIGTQTTLSNAAGTAQIPTHYFRTTFNHSGPASAVLELKALLDDGAVYYLNGVEIFRVGLPAAPAPILYGTFANRTVGDATNEFFYACVGNLVNGENVLAVELHNQSATSSDLTFGTELSILGSSPASRLTITPGPGPNQVTVSWTGNGTLESSTDVSNHPNGWSAVSGVTGNSKTIDMGTPANPANQFFRLAPLP